MLDRGIESQDLSSGGHRGLDQVVMEARRYGLARDSKPFMGKPSPQFQPSVKSRGFFLMNR